jgi:DNA-binding response OmpR family regulator
VIFLTGSSTTDETVCGLQLGACDYITKPFDPAVLTERVRNALKTRRMIDRVPELRSPARPAVRGPSFGKRSHGKPWRTDAPTVGRRTDRRKSPPYGR